MAFLPNLRYGTRSLKTTLALYFIPISIVPTLSISIYALKLFEESLRETLVQRAQSERDAIVGEIEAAENFTIASTRTLAQSPRLWSALSARQSEAIAAAVPKSAAIVRVYDLSGNFIGGKNLGEGGRIIYLSREGLQRVKARGETLERYYSPEGKGFVTLVRLLVRDRSRTLGVLEAELNYGLAELTELKNRRQVDVMILNREFAAYGASFALSNEALARFTDKALRTGVGDNKKPLYVEFGESRYAAFLYDLTSPASKNKRWGYIALFLSMTSVDSTLGKLKLAILYLSLLLALTAALAIFVVSNRLVKPIVLLVSAMKRVKTGREEQLPQIESTYEIEYLVRSFNDMSRNVSAAKRALEIKLEELKDANDNIKSTQTTLVQSAKMISLGQIVAGVAHELNNPIAFIYSNMHHLSEYTEKLKKLVDEYRAKSDKIPAEVNDSLRKLEKELDIDYILKDTEDLVRSCVDGANRTRDIVLGLRTFSRMDESTFRLADVHEGIKSTLKLLSSEFKDRIKVHQEFAELPQIECNLSQLNQVFMNLLTNAGQAITGPGNIWVRTRRLEHSIVVEIEDSGSGIPQGMVEKIFDPFFTTKKVGQGTGLGLSIAYGLIQKHHGTIKVQSQEGKGTKFIIELPVSQPVQKAG